SGYKKLVQRPMTHVGACTALAMTMFAPRFARAEQARVTLSYLSHDVAKLCPDEATFRGLVSARLGYDPFTSPGSVRLSVALQRRKDVAVGTLSLSSDDGKPTGGRTMHAPVAECLELVSSMALAAAVAVDPEAVHAREASPPREPAPAPPPPPPIAPVSS